MRVLTSLPQDDLRKTAAAAQAAEAAGYDGALTMENKNDPFLAHAIAAVSTERMQLGTSVAIAFPRSPMVVANTSWDLQIASRGRFVLGIGPQIRPHNERRFSVPWTAPAPRLREYIQSLRAIWTAWEKGERLRYEGKHYTFTLMPPYFVPASQHLGMVPITLAAVGPHSLRLAGEVADGVRLHGFCTRRYLTEEIVPRLTEGMARSGRDRASFEITGGGFIATGADNDAVAKMVEYTRGRIAFYGSTPGYWPVLELHGLGDLGRKLNAMSKACKWAEMAAEVSDDVVALFTAIGTYAEITAAIERRFGGLSDALNVGGTTLAPTGLPSDLLDDTKRITTPFTGYRTAW
ncbi:MAG TPA: TIGR03617 family F420-dependent LLM class oxidoreductase [Acetobacteraceae bacterium]|jgi:probable F420-dependent oxidoreductase|nr:TIGR03617 family F420-dependent LLM class oxidoreductase [Acetobacteraceae bacterium]